MKRRHKSPTNIALPIACSMAVGVPIVALPVALAQNAAAPAEPEKMEKVIVTGSNIPTAETVGPAPVEAIPTVMIDETASQDVLTVLKKLSSSFSGNGNVGQTLNNRTVGGGEANIAIRNLPTLVLIDGRRLPNSAFSSDSAVDVNTIPVSMIDHIEVLKDGASSIYGSDAIGGVVNIITKKNYTGAEIDAHYGFPLDKTSNHYDEYRFSVVAGTSTEKTHFVAGASYYYSDPLLSKDRTVASAYVPQLLAVSDGTTTLTGNSSTYVSGSFPGRVGNYVLAGSPFVQGIPAYNPSMVTPPVAGGPYTIAQLVAMGVYVPIDNTLTGQQLLAVGNSSRVLINTTDFGTYSMQQQDRRNVFANFDHDLIEKTVTLFGSFFYANNMSEGALAPSPASALGPAGYNQITVPADNPYNPFGTTLGVNGSGSPRVRARFVDFGDRFFDSDYNFYHFVGGFKGNITEKYSYDVAYTYNRYEQAQYSRDGVNGFSLNQALIPSGATDPATGRPLSMLTDANGNQVPVYNVFSLPGQNDPRTIDALRTTLFQTGLSEEWDFTGVIRGTPFELPAGPFGFAVGGQFMHESIGLDADGMFATGNAIGYNPQYPFSPRSRDRASGFAEVKIPVFSEQKNIPGFHSFEISASGRIESLDPGGDSEVPKVGFKWQPIDNQVTIRGTYSQSFIAPTLYNLYGPVTTDAPTVTFNQWVTATEGPPVLQSSGGQVSALYPPNPNLPPSTADTYSLGLVYSPKQIKGLTLSVDYYKIDNPGIAATPDLNAVAASLNAMGVNSPYAGGFTFADNTMVKDHLTAANPYGTNLVNFGNAGVFTYTYVPLAHQRTDGLDFGLNYQLQTENWGKFSLFANANLVLSYDFAGALAPFYRYDGRFTQGVLGAEGTIPDFTVTDGLTWEFKNFTYTITSRFIPGVLDFGDSFPTTGNTWNSDTADGGPWHVGDYYTIDMQLAYEIGKAKADADKKWYDGTRFAVGVNNVTDNLAPFLASSQEDNTDKSTYDIMGRFLYFEISKKF